MSALVEAIVVGAVDVGEADRIVRLLSAERGRTSVVARHARSSKRRFAGVFELGNRVRLQVSPRRGGLEVVTDADVVVAPRLARAELDRIALLAYGCELCAALAPEDHPAAKLVGLLASWLDTLEEPTPPGPPTRIALEGKALTFAGLAPSLVRCVVCGEPIEAPAMFDLEAGGALHARCGGGRPVDPRQLAWMEALRRSPTSEAVNIARPPGTREDWLLSDFARHQLGRDLKSRRLLEELAGS